MDKERLWIPTVIRKPSPEHECISAKAITDKCTMEYCFVTERTRKIKDNRSKSYKGTKSDIHTIWTQCLFE